MEPIIFKYRPVDANGQEAGFFSSKGTLTETELVLHDVTFPLESIYQIINRYDRLTIVYASENGQAMYTIAPYGMDRKLKQTMDRICSYRWAEERRVHLEHAGLGAAFRTTRCPSCTAVVDLSGFAETPQFYCPFCEVLAFTDGQIQPGAADYRLCDRCQFYGHSTRYTAMYVVLNVFSWREHYSCHVCMRRECWKMLAVNLLPPFIGEVFAIYHTIRAYGAGMMDAYLPELVGANAYGQRGRLEDAKALYDTMLERVRVQAGLRYNVALACAKANEWEQSLDGAWRALRDCSNYTPAGTLVNQALVNLHRAAEAEEFLKTWGVPVKPPTLPVDQEAIQRRTTRPDEGIRDTGAP